MINKIKQYLYSLPQENNKLKERVSDLEHLLNIEAKSKITPENVIVSIIKRGIAWYDYEKLNKIEREKYFLGAGDIINNPVFKHFK